MQRAIVPAYDVSVSLASGHHTAHVTRLADARTVELMGADADRALDLMTDDAALHAFASARMPECRA